MRCGFAPGFVNYKKGALDSQPQVIKFISCLPMVDGSLRVLRLLPPLKLVAMILLKVALSIKNQSINQLLNIYGIIIRTCKYPHHYDLHNTEYKVEDLSSLRGL